MKDQNTISVSPEVLVWARESLAISRNQAAERTGISSKRLALLESGERQPTIEELKSMAKSYKRTIATLLLNRPPQEKPLPTDRRTVDSQTVGQFDEKTIIAVRKARALAQSFVALRQEMGYDIPAFTLSARLADDPKALAGRLRGELRLSDLRAVSDAGQALEGYIEKIESLGIVVFQLSLTRDNLRGFSITDDILPIIVLKRGQETSEAKNFTLFHELGHLLLHEGGLCDLSERSSVKIEKWCNAFAAEMLIPQAELLAHPLVQQYREAGNKIWKKKDLLTLSKAFHVGPLAVLRSLLESKLTTRAYYKGKHQQWNKPSFGRSKTPEGRNIPKETISEKGRTFVNLAFQAFDQNRIDLKDLSDFLGVKLSYISKTRELLHA